MKEIGKFKSRMKNVTRSSTEYRMTIPEAKALLDEIIQLELQLAEKPKIVEVEKIIIKTQETISRNLDGGPFIIE